MSLRNRLSENEAIRSIVLPLMRRTSFDLTLKHPWVDGVRFSLNSYRHKGYWFFGRARERDSMLLFAALVRPGAAVAEVGGHIGFISAFFAELAGPGGTLTVFEPGRNNLPYIRRNVAGYAHNPRLAPITLIEKAVGVAAGRASFYEDDLTGQNNSLVADFDVLASNTRSAHVVSAVVQREVDIVAVDEVFDGRPLDFIKIDVEGFEYGVLQGMAATLRAQRPVVMVEVQAAEADIAALFADAGYRLFDEQRREATRTADLRGNMFALHRAAHADLITAHF